MNMDYQIRTDGEERYATFSRRNVYFEVPIFDTDVEQDIQDRLDAAALSVLLTNIKRTCINDAVYSKGVVVRNDYSICLPEGQALLSQLDQAFPGHMVWERNDLNLIGSYHGYRPPYENESISWYDFEAYPSEDLLAQYGAQGLYPSFKNWYGMKFDLVTGKILLKLVVDDIDIPKPDLPKGSKFYAVTHGVGGFVAEWVDCYVYATSDRMKAWCLDKSVDYALPDEVEDDGCYVWVWGVVFNKDTLEIGSVKAYARYDRSHPHDH